ncbi:MAG: hypothetical protein DI586_08395 [Micavibrio aeruginosavorus]|uniref:DUF1009 domain-containing protein n=1 Tax=Micavibrio aeruginosavorus TaxID=349221 RepID=A0A2W5FJ04_9BACT|nr:MAG: hypothetical protein DI586_08395 [Micavibrio aeruginosavorus]
MRPGLIAGAGKLPYLLIEKWKEQGFSPAIIAIDGFAESDLYADSTGITIPLGSAGKMISYLKQNNVTDLVVTGRVSRPDLMRLKPDPRGMMIIAKILLKKKIGDDALLRIIKSEIEKDGFRLRSVQEFVPDILTPEGLLTKTPIPPEASESVEIGFQVARDHGSKDLGQSIVVQNGSVIGLESEKGTNALIREAAKNKQTGIGPILVKTCKPQQEKALDLPTIGISTAREVQAAGFSGIVLQAHDTILLDREDVIEFCDAHNIFLYGKAA